MTTPMPTPNIPDEVMEAAVEAMRSDEFRVFGECKTPNNGARKEAMRAALQTALPLLLEQKGYAYSGHLPYADFTKFRSTPAEDYEPLYRLKVSNEQ